MVWVSTALVLFLCSLPAHGQTAPHTVFSPEFPFQDACIGAHWPEANVARKGIALRLGDGASMLFDTELLRMAAGWTGGFITRQGPVFNGEHDVHPQIDGTQRFAVPMVMGWSAGDAGFRDPRPEPYGLIPPELGRWRGLYLNGMKVVLAYEVRGTLIQEHPSAQKQNDYFDFTRTFRVSKTTTPLSLLVCAREHGKTEMHKGIAVLTGPDETHTTCVGATGLPEGAHLLIDQGRVILRLPPLSETALFQVTLRIAPQSAPETFRQSLARKLEFVSFEQGGPRRWNETVVTRGSLATSRTPDGAYVTDRLSPPLSNPWNRSVRFAGLDFFSDGQRAALCTWEGDVWIVSGLDDKLDDLRWTRFASGLYEPLGLTIVDDVIYTAGRDQLTRFHDLNADGEADFYENFCNLYSSTENALEFVLDLQTDAHGNFYFAKAGPLKPGGQGFETISPHAGTLMKVSSDGTQLEVMATGLRAPNGIGIGPNGQITLSDNEGNWVPASPVHWVQRGRFFGVVPLAHRNPVPDASLPLCWLARKDWDNSAAGQVWVTTDRWGPYQGELLHCSYGKASLFHVLRDQSSGIPQGGVVRLPVEFSSSAMRPKFNASDGQLYVAGLRGWNTDAKEITGLNRVRYTGKPVYSVKSLHTRTGEIHLGFTQPLDPKEAKNPDNYSILRWNYNRTNATDSAEYSVSDPDKTGRDQVLIESVGLNDNGHTVILKIPSLRPTMQQQIRFFITASDGTPIKQEILHTIHTLE